MNWAGLALIAALPILTLAGMILLPVIGIEADRRARSR